MKIEDVMNEEVILAGENEQVSHARNLMLKHGYSRILVVDPEGKPVGIITEKDLIRKMRANGPQWKRRPIDKISIRQGNDSQSGDHHSLPGTQGSSGAHDQKPYQLRTGSR